MQSAENQSVHEKDGSDKLLREWDVAPSIMGKAMNPMTNMVFHLKLVPNPQKSPIYLSIGDPTVFKNLRTPDSVLRDVADALLSGKYNGQARPSGHESARQAIANFVSREGSPITSEDVFICSGCSSALDICIPALANRGDNILVPRPGFPLCKILSQGLGIETRDYNLLPDQNWEVDLNHLESLVDPKTRAIVVNNPSNPCGSVYDARHLKAILGIAERHHIPIIADEIYSQMVFRNKRFVSVASVSKNVPILSCGGIGKRFLVPGWRIGWITVHDRNNAFQRVEMLNQLNRMSARIEGGNTLVQGALPSMLAKTPKSFFQSTLDFIESNARVAHDKLGQVEGLNPIMPDGAMYMMLGMDMKVFPNLSSCAKVMEALFQEESIQCLPGVCFGMENFLRIVLTIPIETLIEACDRMTSFFSRHHIKNLSRSG